jgi:nucleotide-binding universal stress UspA family protein
MAFDRILVAIDGSEGGERAFAKGLELAGLTGAHVLALAVEGPLPAYAATVGEVEEVKREKDAFFGRLLANARKQAEAAGIELEVELRPGHAAELIVRVAREWQADLIVLGHKGHFLRDHLLGSTADRVAEHADCPVMIIKG